MSSVPSSRKKTLHSQTAMINPPPPPAQPPAVLPPQPSASQVLVSTATLPRTNAKTTAPRKKANPKAKGRGAGRGAGRGTQAVLGAAPADSFRPGVFTPTQYTSGQGGASLVYMPDPPPGQLYHLSDEEAEADPNADAEGEDDPDVDVYANHEADSYNPFDFDPSVFGSNMVVDQPPPPNFELASTSHSLLDLNAPFATPLSGLYYRQQNQPTSSSHVDQLPDFELASTSLSLPDLNAPFIAPLSGLYNHQQPQLASVSHSLPDLHVPPSAASAPPAQPSTTTMSEVQLRLRGEIIQVSSRSPVRSINN